MAALLRRYNQKEEEFFLTLTWPQEDRRRFTIATWSGGYRWFKSDNITPIEYYRRVRIQAPAPTKRAG